MSAHYDRRILAYHGTSKKTAKRILRSGEFVRSNNDYDWLGNGIYFWEDGPDRASKWAAKKHGADATIVGAILQLGLCYDLMDTRFTLDLRDGARDFAEVMTRTGVPLPVNKPGQHKLDCAVINWWLDQLEKRGTSYQTVRRGFEEGTAVFPGMAITMESHVQIAVRDPACILGVFTPNVVVASTARARGISRRASPPR